MTAQHITTLPLRDPFPGRFFMRLVLCIFARFMQKKGCIICKIIMFYTHSYAKSYILYTLPVHLLHVACQLFAKQWFNE